MPSRGREGGGGAPCGGQRWPCGRGRTRVGRASARARRTKQVGAGGGEGGDAARGGERVDERSLAVAGRAVEQGAARRRHAEPAEGVACAPGGARRRWGGEGRGCGERVEGR
eukprot:5774811-Prymnesium_polylepis.1